MDTKKLELFADAAETLNFTKTGERMGYTQSGVSHMLKALEQELGFSLFIRMKKGVALTVYAKDLLPSVRELLRANEHFEQTAASLNGMALGHLTIGTFDSVSIHWLPAIIRRFNEDYPNISIRIKEGGSKDIEEWLSQGLIDIGFFSRQPRSSFEWIPLRKDPLVAVLPSDFEIGDDESFPFERFLEYPLIKPESGYDYDIEDAFASVNIHPQIRFTSTNDLAIISMVANHLGISLMPKLMLEGFDSSVKIRNVEPKAYRMLGIGMLSLSQLTPAAKEFIHYVKEESL